MTTTLVELVAARLEAYGVAVVERALLDTEDPAQIAAAFEELCRRALGVGVAAGLEYATSAGILCALALDDGREVAVKLHGPAYGRDYLGAVRTVQAALADRGFPAPRPLAGPLPLGRGLATVDAYLPGGRADGHEPAVREAMAETLARLVRDGAPFRGLPGLTADPRHGRPVPDDLWGPPHSPIFDLPGTVLGAEWIDAIGRLARDRLVRPAGEAVLGHLDWSVKNLGWAGAEVVAVYDWDSVVVAAEPVLVGEAARGFTATWELPVEPAPSPAEAAAFVAAYEEARGRPFDAEERATAEAAALFAAAGIARFEHALDAHAGTYPRGSFRDRLARHGEAWFRFG